MQTKEAHQDCSKIDGSGMSHPIPNKHYSPIRTKIDRPAIPIWID